MEAIDPRIEQYLNGQLVLINKQLTWTSFNIVHKLRVILEQNLKLKRREMKVGHAGTLDPLATGLMILLTGKATKTTESLMGLDKEYIATMYLGATTPSFDLETAVDKRFEIGHITEEVFEQTLQLFRGAIEQVPPMYSAKFVNGKRAYEYARKGKIVEMEARQVKIYELQVLEYKMPEVVLRVSCSKGTYIRSLVRDIGEALQSGAYLSALTRTKIGAYSLDDALTIEEFQKKLQST